MGEQLRLREAVAVAEHVQRARAATWGELCNRFGQSAVRTAVRRGLIASVLPGIYSQPDSRDTLAVRAKALTVWTAPAGLITGMAGAHLWGVVDDVPRRITVQVAPMWHHKVPAWVRLLRVPPPSTRFATRGIAVVSAPDAVVQAWREARPDVAVATVIAAVMRGVTTASDLLDALSRRKQVPRRGQLAELLSIVGTHVTSYLEYVAWREVFPPRLYSQLQWQVTKWPNARKRVFDAWDAEAGIDLEFDGGGTHGGTEAFERDRQRDADVRSEGWEPLHFTYRDLVERPAWCREQYRLLRAARLGRLSSRIGT